MAIQSGSIGIDLTCCPVMLKPIVRLAGVVFPAVVFLCVLPHKAASQEPLNSDTIAADTASRAQRLKAVRVNARSARSRYAPTPSRTATRTPALSRDVPQAMVTINGQLMRDQAMQGLADVARFVPGATMAQGEGNRDQVTIRGNNSTADFFVDGVRDDTQYFRDLYNVERVDALKGSNAMVFGRGGGGGILNRVTKAAQWRSRHEVTVEGGTFGGRRVSTDLQQNLAPWMSGRLNSVYENSDLYRDGATLDRSGINPTLAIGQPSGATRASIGYEYFEDRRTADRGIPSFNNKPVKTDPSTFFGNPEASRSNAKVNSAQVTLSHDAGAFQIRNHSRFANYDKYYQNIFPGAVNGSGTMVSISGYNNATGRNNLFNQTDVNVRANTASVVHDILVGAEVGRQSTDNLRSTAFFNGDATSVLVPVSNPRPTASMTFVQRATDASNETVVRTKSVYVQDQITLTPKFVVIGGARYENFDLRFEDRRSEVKRDRSDDMISPRAGVIYKPSGLVSVYASYGISFLPGSGDQFASLTEVTEALKPERFTNYEAGVKWDLLDRLAITGAVYRLDRTNTRSIDPADPRLLLQAGAQRSQGVELGATGSMTSSWEIAAGFANQSAKITAATAASETGARLPLVPKTSVSIWNKYSFTDRLGAAVGVLHQSRVFTGIDNTVELPSFQRFDAAFYAGLGFGLRGQLNIENVLDTRYYPTAHSNNNITPGSPRAFRLSLTAGF